MTNLAIIKTYIQLLMKAHEFIFESGDRQGFSYEKKYTDVFGDERKQIISIANVMEEKGFLLLDKCSQDSDDVIPTLEEQQDLLLHHDSYLEAFCSNYDVNIECLSDILEIIKNEIDSMPAKSAGANREKIMILAAALGQVYEANGGIWEFDNGNQSVMVSIYRSIKIPAGMPKVPGWLVYPINTIWDFVQNKHEGGNIKDYILSSLSNFFDKAPC